MKPERWSIQKNKLFTYQVGFTSPPFDFDAAPSDFLRISAVNVGAHGRMLHAPGYARFLKQAGFGLVYYGNFTDMGYFNNQQECDDCVWVFDGELAEKSMQYVVEQAADIDAIVVRCISS
jgi:hypothetical protein